MQPLLFPRDLLRFLYWVFFKPITLHRYIHQIDPTLSGDFSLLTLWIRSISLPRLRPLISLAFFHLLFTPWLLGFGTAALFALAGWEVNWLGVAVGVAGGVAFGVAVDVAGGVGFCIGYFRLLNYLFEAPCSFFLSRLPGGASLRLSPIVWDEVIWLPLIGLDRQLVAIGKQDRQEGMKAIAYTAGSFRQGWAARQALLELTAYDVQASNSLEAIATISDTLAWLPAEAQTAYKSLLLDLETVSKHARAALESDTLYNRGEQLRLALALTQQIRQGFAFDPNWRISRVMAPALEVWERLFAEELAAVKKQEAIPNVYVAGTPLDPQSKVFRGRRDVFHALERELASPAGQRPAILLFGARRTGKTSVLRQLPEALGPQVIPVAVDLQDAALEKDAAGLFLRVIEKIRDDALSFRRLLLPAVERAALEANPYTAFSDWLKNAQASIGERWILLNLDEYEYLETMLADGRVDERAFQLLRTLLQNHPRLTLLFSGAHIFGDLNPIWSHYLINLRVIKIGMLREEEARELITQPIPSFPLVYTPNAVKAILNATACQPYLIQAVCRDLVNAMNERHRFHAAVRDVEQAFQSVLVSAGSYFEDLWNGPDTDEAQRTVMRAIARSKAGALGRREISLALQCAAPGQSAKVGKQALQRLERRGILKSEKGEWRFQIELVRRWVRRAD